MNSPLFLAAMALFGGGVVASRLTARWQRANQVFQLRIEAFRKLVEQHFHWGETFFIGDTPESQPSADLLKAQAVTIEFIRAVFPGPKVQQALHDFWDAIAERTRRKGSNDLAKIQQLQIASAEKYRQLIDLLASELAVPK